MKGRLGLVGVILVGAQLACALLNNGTNSSPEASAPALASSAPAMAQASKTPPGSAAKTPYAAQTLPVGATPPGAPSPEAAAPLDAPTPAAKLAPLELPTAQPGPATLDLSDPAIYKDPLRDEIDRLEDAMLATGPDGQPLLARIRYARQRQAEPPAWASSSTLFDETAQEEKISLQGKLYTNRGNGECSVVEAQLPPPAGPSAGLAGLLVGEAPRVEQNVNVNGMAADRYAISADNLKPGGELNIVERSAEVEASSTATITIPLSGAGSLYLAQQGGFMLKLELSDTGVAGEREFFFKPGSPMTRTLVIERIPAALGEPRLAAPKDCGGREESGNPGNPDGPDAPVTLAPTATPLAGGLPRPADAQVMVEDRAQLLFTSALSVEEATNFYLEKLPALGWVKGDTMTMGGLSTLSFTKDGGALTISIVATDTGTLVTIIIT